MNLQILYEDSQLLVVNKPAGLIVDPSITNSEITLADILKKDYGITLDRGGVVHRLDKDTSGIILVAKTQHALEALQSQFKNREVKKTYLALVHGFMEKEEEVEGIIARNPRAREKFIVIDQDNLAEGKTAQTNFKPQSHYRMTDQKIQEIFSDYSKIQLRKLYAMRYPLFTLLECHPLTGRTHQIRVHLKHIGSPIVGDEKYGGRKTVRLDHRWCQRQFLHAQNIKFAHPQSGEQIEFSASLSEDLNKSLSFLEKQSKI